jgi:SAM-dependent methyltransferase
VSSPYETTERPEIHDLIPLSARRFLDVGSNDGGFGAWLKLQVTGREVVCVEPDRAQAEKARAWCDHVIPEFYPEALRQVSGEFDCITFNHVLEHMVDPWDALAQTRDRLSEGGCVVAVVPNIRYLPVAADLVLRGRWDYQPSGHLDKTHLRFFTRSSVRPLFEQAGLNVDVLRPVNCIGNRRTPIGSRILGVTLGDLAYGAFAVRASASDRRPS